MPQSADTSLEPEKCKQSAKYSRAVSMPQSADTSLEHIEVIDMQLVGRVSMPQSADTSLEQ